MFVKNSPALQDTVDRILTIFEMLIVNSGGLEEAEKLEQWRNAVRGIRQELVHSSLSGPSPTGLTTVPHLLIGMDKYIHWMENLGRSFNIVHHAFKTLIDLDHVHGASHGSQGVNRPYTDTKHSIGTTTGDMSEVVEEDIEMDDIEPARGRSQKRGRLTSKSRQPSRTPHSRSRNGTKGQKERCQRGGRLHAHDIPPPFNQLVPKFHARPPPKLPPATPPHLAAEIHLVPPKPAREITPAEEEDSPSPPPNKKPWLSKGGQAEASSSSVQPRRIIHQRLDDIIRHQDQMMGRIDEGERQTAEVFRRIA
ncbi:hypothetical protein EV401DRAFT_1895640, partial [Pisolithus croceorrhizus]